MAYQLEIRDRTGVRYAPVDPGGEDGAESAADLALRWGEMEVRVVPAREAALEELSGEPDAAAAPGEAGLRALARLRAGVRVEGRRAPREAVGRWRERVLEGAFEPDRCAADLNEGAGPQEEEALLGRSASLLRDMLMAELGAGARGAARRVRRVTRGAVARLTAQVVVVAVYTLLAFATLVLLRFRGVELDGFLDSVLEAFGTRAGGAG